MVAYSTGEATMTLEHVMRLWLVVAQAINKGVAKKGLDSQWREKSQGFARAFCIDQEIDPDSEWMDLPNTTTLGPKSISAFEELRTWLESEHPEVFGVL